MIAFLGEGLALMLHKIFQKLLHFHAAFCNTSIKWSKFLLTAWFVLIVRVSFPWGRLRRPALWMIWCRIVSNFWNFQAAGRFGLVRVTVGWATICIPFERLWAIMEAIVKTWFDDNLLHGTTPRTVSVLASPNMDSWDPRPLWNKTTDFTVSVLLVIYPYETVIKRFKVSMPDHFNPYRFKLRNVTGYRSGINFNVFNNFSFIRAYNLWRRIIKQALTMQSQKQFSAGHVFKPAVGRTQFQFWQSTLEIWVLPLSQWSWTTVWINFKSWSVILRFRMIKGSIKHCIAD